MRLMASLFAVAVSLQPSSAFCAGIDGVQIKLKGRLLLDSLSEGITPSDEAESRTDIFRVRQAFLGMDARFSDRLSLRFEGGASGNDAFIWDEAALEYKATPHLILSAGNLKAAGLENLTSLKTISFLERGPYGDLVTDPFVGSVQARANLGALAATLAVQGDTFNNLGLDFDGTAAPGARDRRAVTARLAGSLAAGPGGRLHLGGWVRARDFGDGFARAYQGRPGTAIGETADWLSSGPISRGDRTSAIEAAWMSGPFWLQGEAAAVRVDRSPRATPGEDPVFTSGYVFAGWNLNGEARGYDPQKALVTAPKVRSPLSKGGLGSLDLLARYDFADLSGIRDSAATPAGQFAARRAGDYRGVTLGAVWRPETGYRVVVNLGEAWIDHAPPQADVRIRQVQVRAQYEF